MVFLLGLIALIVSYLTVTTKCIEASLELGLELIELNLSSYKSFIGPEQESAGTEKYYYVLNTYRASRNTIDQAAVFTNHLRSANVKRTR